MRIFFSYSIRRPLNPIFPPKSFLLKETFYRMKTKIISNQKLSFPRNHYQESDFSSTLLVPEKYITLFYQKISHHKGVRSYIAYLLNKYQIYIANGLIPSYCKVTTKYQEKGQNLQRIAFRRKPEDWAELKLYRLSFGMSISALVVYLLIADSVDFAETFSNYLTSVGISPIPQFDLFAKVQLCNKRSDYTIIFQYRKGHYH